MQSTAGSGQALNPTWRNRLDCLWSAASCWVMAGLFVTAWWWPRALEEGRWVRYGVGILVLEFILIHSGGFLNYLMTQRAGWQRNRTLGVLLAYYTVFGVGIALAFQSWWILGSFAFVTFGRVWSVFAGESYLNRAISLRRVAASAMLFLGLTFATIFIPVPSGGITRSLLGEVWPKRGSGLWEREPERALAMGAAYFLLLGLVEARPPRKSWQVTGASS